MGKRCLPDTAGACAWVQSLQTGQEEYAGIVKGVASLFANGVSVDAQQIVEGAGAASKRQAVRLPTTAFSRDRHWFAGHNHDAFAPQ
jgi:acyl transferase domain-containing protein